MHLGGGRSRLAVDIFLYDVENINGIGIVLETCFLEATEHQRDETLAGREIVEFIFEELLGRLRELKNFLLDLRLNVSDFAHEGTVVIAGEELQGANVRGVLVDGEAEGLLDLFVHEPHEFVEHRIDDALEFLFTVRGEEFALDHVDEAAYGELGLGRRDLAHNSASFFDTLNWGTGLAMPRVVL